MIRLLPALRSTILVSLLCVSQLNIAAVTTPANLINNIKKEYKIFKEAVRCLYSKKECTEEQKKRLQLATAGLIAIVSAGSYYYLKPIIFNNSLSTQTGSSHSSEAASSQVSSGPRIITLNPAMQTGLTCGYHALKNAYIIASALQAHVVDVKDEWLNQALLSPKSELFVSNCQPGERGEWRNRIEEMRRVFNDPSISITEDTLEGFEIVNLILNNPSIAEGKIFGELPYAVYAPALNIDSQGLVGTNALKREISNFKNDSNRYILPIIINTGGHWIADILYKRDQNILHYIADSLGGQWENRSPVKEVVNMTR